MYLISPQLTQPTQLCLIRDKMKSVVIFAIESNIKHELYSIPVCSINSSLFQHMPQSPEPENRNKTLSLWHFLFDF